MACHGPRLTVVCTFDPETLLLQADGFVRNQAAQRRRQNGLEALVGKSPGVPGTRGGCALDRILLFIARGSVGNTHFRLGSPTAVDELLAYFQISNVPALWWLAALCEPIVGAAHAKAQGL